jgi:DNA mismatch repair protein MSH5
MPFAGFLKGGGLHKASVRELLSAHELPKLLDEAISEEEQLDMDLASAVCQRFLEWDLRTQEAESGEVRKKMAKVLGQDVDRSDNE